MDATSFLLWQIHYKGSKMMELLHDCQVLSFANVFARMVLKWASRKPQSLFCFFSAIKHSMPYCSVSGLRAACSYHVGKQKTLENDSHLRHWGNMTWLLVLSLLKFEGSPQEVQEVSKAEHQILQFYCHSVINLHCDFCISLDWICT